MIYSIQISSPSAKCWDDCKPEFHDLLDWSCIAIAAQVMANHFKIPVRVTIVLDGVNKSDRLSYVSRANGHYFQPK